MNKRGQKPWITPPEEDGGKDLQLKLERIKELARFTDVEREIYHGLGTNHDTWYRYKKLYSPEFTEALTQGWDETFLKVKTSLFGKALAGDINAMRFILERKGEWREKQDLQMSGPDGKPIQIKATGFEDYNDDQLIQLAPEAIKMLKEKPSL